MKHKIILITGVLLLWECLALYVHKEAILPFPQDVFLRMLYMLKDLSFYTTLLITLSHVIIVVLMSAILSFIVAYWGAQKPIVEEYVSPVLSFLQAVPNISFVILVLVWNSSLQTIYIVLFLVVFPLLYNNFIEGFKNIDQDLKDVILLYHPPLLYKFIHVYLPLIKPSVLSGIRSSLSLGVKVAVMAEILVALPYGVGRAIQYARIQVDMIGVFAWTLWLILMILMFEYILRIIINVE